MLLRSICKPAVFYSKQQAEASGRMAAAEQLGERLQQLEQQAAAFSTPNEFGSILSQAGAVGLNATTSHDATRYFMAMPINKLELWFAMEAERFRVCSCSTLPAMMLPATGVLTLSLFLSTSKKAVCNRLLGVLNAQIVYHKARFNSTVPPMLADSPCGQTVGGMHFDVCQTIYCPILCNCVQAPVFRELYSEKRVVLEERRMRVDDSPMGRFQEGFAGQALTNNYRRPVIGYVADLSLLGRQEVQSFFNKHYGPQRLCISVVGDVQVEEVSVFVLLCWSQYINF